MDRKNEANSLVRSYPRKLHISEYTDSCFKNKKSIVLYSNKGTINYNQQCHPLHLGNKQYKQFPQKKKKRKISQEGEREEGKSKKESVNEKGKEKEKEKKGKERKRE